MKIYNKLVRDNIPEIIEKEGRVAKHKVLGDNEFYRALVDKLKEEFEEYLDSESVEELVDILEVIEAIAKENKVSFKKIVEMKEKKKIERGGFTKKIFLENVTNPKALKVDGGDLEMAFQDRESKVYLNLDDGTFRWLSEYSSDDENDEIEEGNFIRIEPMESRDAYRMMQEFVDEMVNNSKAADDLIFIKEGAEMKLWDLFDENRQKLNRTHCRDKNMQIGEYHVVVEVWTINNKAEILLTLRHQNKKDYPNFWENTGGSVLAGETRKEGAVRELMEETGIEIKAEELIFLGTKKDKNVFYNTYMINKSVEINARR